MGTKKMIDISDKNPPKFFLVGVDEAGRGPLAGPVTIGIVAIEKKKAPAILKKLKKLGLYDSKKVSESNREEILKYAKTLDIFYTTVSIGQKYIDEKGISKAVRAAILRGFKRIPTMPEYCDVRLDGLLRAPDSFTKQRTIIKGDQLEPIISLASIFAKVSRDKKMVMMAKKFPKYGFEVHKGYGTKSHREAIKKHGMCELHRISYCSNLIKQ